MVLLLVQHFVATDRGKKISRSVIPQCSLKRFKVGDIPACTTLYISYFMIWTDGQTINLLNNEDVLDNFSEMYIAMTRC